MNFCPHCGARIESAPTFCPNCGQRLAADTAPTAGWAPSSAPAGAPTAPAAADPEPLGSGPAGAEDVSPAGPAQRARFIPPPAKGGVQAAAPVDVRAVLLRALTGNWVGAGVVTGAAAAAAFVMSLVYAELELNDHADISGIFANGSNLFFAVFGVPIEAHDGHTTVTLVTAPLLITFVVAALAVVVFKNVTAGYPDKVAALGDAVRTGLVLAVFMTVAMVVVRIVDPTQAATKDDGAPFLGLPLAGSGDVHGRPSVAGAIFIPAMALMVVLSAAVLRSALPAAGRMVAVAADVAVPVIQSVRTLLWLLVPAGVVLMVAGDTSSGDLHTPNTLESVTRDVVALPNYGYSTLGIGLGAPWGSRGESFPDQVWRVGGLADQMNWVVWLSIPVATLVAMLAGFVVVRTARVRSLVCAGVYLVALLAVLPLLGLAANLAYHSHASYGSDAFGTARIGADMTELTFTFFGGSVLVCLAALLVLGKLTLAPLQARPPGGPAHAAGFPTGQGAPWGADAQTAYGAGQPTASTGPANPGGFGPRPEESRES